MRTIPYVRSVRPENIDNVRFFRLDYSRSTGITDGRFVILRHKAIVKLYFFRLFQQGTSLNQTQYPLSGAVFACHPAANNVVCQSGSP
jgi:hypothetical protein